MALLTLSNAHLAYGHVALLDGTDFSLESSERVALIGIENVAESVTKGTRLIVTGRLDQRSWESDSGEKRSKVEIVADEIGPSLRWATAEVSKNERRSEGAPQQGTKRAPSHDEEPF